MEKKVYMLMLLLALSLFLISCSTATELTIETGSEEIPGISCNTDQDCTDNGYCTGYTEEPCVCYDNECFGSVVDQEEMHQTCETSRDCDCPMDVGCICQDNLCYSGGSSYA